ncbi:MAG: 50S ribosomal protein L32 [Candidatus Omnitrophica bacterium]|nr:50S ribosomal protein L32 [Candidatus Omnitrophota bacterium]
MPLPKKRHSKARGRKRRTHWKIPAVGLVACPQCKALKKPHQVCSVCGSYSGRQVLTIEEKKEKKKEI